MAFRFAIFLLIFSSTAPVSGGEEEHAITPAGRAFFETKIRPALIENCYECHSADTAAEDLGGKLLLDTRGGLLTGGESGPALVAGNPEKSLLIQSLHWQNDLEMPPKEPLAEPLIRDFIRWIEMGAPDPRSGAKKELAGIDYEEGALWSFEPVANPEPPALPESAGWPRAPIDRFVLAQMKAMNLEPAADASPETLIRRLFFDLTGLPPDLSQVQAFAAAFESDAEAAIERLVDDLLESPHFGERWGRHWLDVARYAESNGNDGLSRNPTFPHAWRYRDYVIAALNDDVPYDRFLIEQIAGDLLPAKSPEERDRLLVATGFLALGAKPAKAMNNNFAMDVVADQLDVIGKGLIGLGIGCARCHDHKFDPIPTRDYYAMAGIFTSTETMWGLAANEKLTAPPTDLHVLKAAPKVLPPADFKETVVLRESNTGKPKAIPKPKWEAGTPLAMGARDTKKPADCKINLKGDAKKLGDPVPRGFLSAYEIAPEIRIDPKRSGRLELAQWLASAKHPQTARVMANRIWLHLFGRGLVGTPDDFGVYGDRPTHPELLDHLASRFAGEGWSVKSLIRTIVLSRTYRLDSQADADAIATDPDNLWLSRHTRRRLDAEELRDAMLKVSGHLDPAPGDGSQIRHRDILVNLAGYSLHEPSDRRSIYLCFLRDSPPPELAAFDLPDFRAVNGKRDLSTRPGQALYLFNNPFVVEQAGHLAKSVTAASEKGEDRIRQLYRQALNREPGPEELYRAIELIEATAEETGSREDAWASLSQALLVSNEFRYID